MRKTLCRALVASLLVVFTAVPPQAWAWGSPGHMAVAYVAYQQLTPDKQQRVQALLKLNPNYKTWLTYIPAGTTAAKKGLYLFMMAATWPDEIKASGSGYHSDGPNGGDTPGDPTESAQNLGYTDKDLHKYWHFVDRPLSPDNSGPTTVPVPDAETQIKLFRTELASTTMTKAEDRLKSYDLVWLEHLVGDVHQPLHCVTRYLAGTSDSGGNGVNLTDPPHDLHTYWDDVPGKGVTKNFATAVKFASPLPPAPTDQTGDTTVSDWVDESFKLAVDDAYANPPIGQAAGKGAEAFTLTDSYKQTALSVAQERIALAGARLAKLIQENLN